MKLPYSIVALLAVVLFLAGWPVIHDYTATFVRNQCHHWLTGSTNSRVIPPQLSHASSVTLTKYTRMQNIRLTNQGGRRLYYCDGFEFPSGLNVMLTADGRSCEISGVPSQSQARTNAYVVAANQGGRSLAIIQITVNPIVMDE